MQETSPFTTTSDASITVKFLNYVLLAENQYTITQDTQGAMILAILILYCLQFAIGLLVWWFFWSVLDNCVSRSNIPDGVNLITPRSFPTKVSAVGTSRNFFSMQVGQVALDFEIRCTCTQVDDKEWYFQSISYTTRASKVGSMGFASVDLQTVGPRLVHVGGELNLLVEEVEFDITLSSSIRGLGFVFPSKTYTKSITFDAKTAFGGSIISPS